MIDPSKATRKNKFDAIRFLLATLVIASHSYPLLRDNNASEPVSRLTGGQLTGGELAIDGFFALSGFLIVQSWERSRSAIQYFRKRILRIYPGFLFAVLFGAFVVAPRIASDSSDYWSRFSVASFLGSTLNLDTRLPKVFANLPVPAVNGSLWSIRYEFLCYIGVAMLGMAGAFRYRFAILIAFAICLTLHAGQIFLGLRLPSGGLATMLCDPGPWPRLAAFFLSGVLFHLYADRITHSHWIAGAALLLLGISSQIEMLPLALPVFGTYLLFHVAYLPIPRLDCFAGRGDLSYGLYLYAFPIQQWLVHQYGDSLTPITLFLAAFPITILLAAISWRFIERPFLVRKSPPGEPVNGPGRPLMFPIEGPRRDSILHSHYPSIMHRSHAQAIGKRLVRTDPSNTVGLQDWRGSL